MESFDPKPEIQNPNISECLGYAKGLNVRVHSLSEFWGGWGGCWDLGGLGFGVQGFGFTDPSSFEADVSG